MKISIGSTNPIKISAIKEALQDYKFLKAIKYQSFEVKTGVPSQPLTLDQTISGAKTRAKNAYAQFHKTKQSSKVSTQKNKNIQHSTFNIPHSLEIRNSTLDIQSNQLISFGLEDGLIPVPHTKTDYMNVCCCAIYDGKEFHLGLSSAFEYPKKITKLVLNGKHDISSAYKKCGLTKKKKLGSKEGAVGLLTHGRINRTEYTKQAITMAMIHLENSNLF